MIIDTHCHISSDDFENVDLIIDHMGENIMIFSGASDSYNKEVVKTVQQYNNVYGTLGLHPDEADVFTDENIQFIENNINSQKIIGIGEIGLDYHYVNNNKDKQKELFIEQLKLARKYHKTVVIHSRDAIEDTFNIMMNYRDLNYILHCYGSSVEMANKFIANFNIKFGIGGVLTFKNGKRLQDVVKKIDLKYFVLETDCPFMAPEPLRGTKNEPYNIIYVAKKMAEIKNMNLEDILKITTDNALNIYQIKGK